MKYERKALQTLLRHALHGTIYTGGVFVSSAVEVECLLGQVAFKMLVVDCTLLHYLKSDRTLRDVLNVCAFLSV